MKTEGTLTVTTLSLDKFARYYYIRMFCDNDVQNKLGKKYFSQTCQLLEHSTQSLIHKIKPLLIQLAMYEYFTHKSKLV